MLHRHKEALLGSVLAVAALGGVACKNPPPPAIKDPDRCYQPGATHTRGTYKISSTYPVGPCLKDQKAFELLSDGCEQFQKISPPKEGQQQGHAVCCYEVEAQRITDCSAGRPLLVGGRLRLARLAGTPHLPLGWDS